MKMAVAFYLISLFVIWLQLDHTTQGKCNFRTFLLQLFRINELTLRKLMHISLYCLLDCINKPLGEIGTANPCKRWQTCNKVRNECSEQWKDVVGPNCKNKLPPSLRNEIVSRRCKRTCSICGRKHSNHVNTHLIELRYNTCFIVQCISIISIIYLADGGWGPWNDKVSCSETCGSGTKTMTRSCDNPSPRNGGKECDGENTKTVPCNEGACPGNTANQYFN